MGLFDNFSAQTPEGDALRMGLLQAGLGMMQGANDPRNNGRFAPAMAQGMAGFAGGMTQAQEMEMKRQMMAQRAAQEAQANHLRQLQTTQIQRDLRNQDQATQFFDPAAGGPQAIPGGAPAGGGIDAQIQAGLTSPNPEIRKWAIETQRLRLQQTGGMSGLVPTQSGYAYRDQGGNMVMATGPDGQPLMPVSALGQDPTRQGEIVTAKETAKAGVERDSAQVARDLQDERRMTLFDTAEQLIPLSSSGSLSNLRTAAADAAGISTDASKADAQLRVIAGEFLGLVPRFEGPQSDKDIQAYREMAGDLANPQLPAETRIAVLRKMREMVLERTAKRSEGTAQQAPAQQAAPATPAASQSKYSNLWGG